MAATVHALKGRAFLMKFDFSGVSPTSYTLLTGMRSTQMKINGNQVDITSKLSGGWQELLSDAGVRKIEMSASGIFDDTPSNVMMQLQKAALDNTQVNAEIIFGDTPAAVVLAGQWFIGDLTLDSPYDNVTTFSLTLMSNGVVTYATV